MALVALCLGYFMVILDVTVVSVAVPSIGRDLSVGVTGLQWVVDGYTLVFAMLLLPSGGAGDRLGGRRVLLTGLCVFTVASLGCAAAPSAGLLVAARLAQGVGAALQVPASLSLLRAAYPDRAARARAFGAWGAVAGVAAGAGPVLGGLLVSGWGWRSVFALNLPVGLLALVLTVRYVPAPAATGWDGRRGLDLPAQSLGALAVAALTGGLIEVGGRGWSAPPVLASAAVAVLAGGGFVLLERRARHPLLPPILFASHTFRVAAAVGLLLNLGFYGMIFVATVYFQQLRGYDARTAGLALLPALGMAMVSSALAGRVTARTGPRLPMVLGLVVGAAGLFGWLLAGPATGYPVLAVAMLAAGFGTAFTMPAATAAIMSAAPEATGGVAAAVFNAGRQVGSAVGVALLGSLLVGPGRFVPGLHAGALVAGCGFLLAAALAATVRPGTPGL